MASPCPVPRVTKALCGRGHRPHVTGHESRLSQGGVTRPRSPGLGPGSTGPKFSTRCGLLVGARHAPLRGSLRSRTPFALKPWLALGTPGLRASRLGGTVSPGLGWRGARSRDHVLCPARRPPLPLGSRGAPVFLGVWPSGTSSGSASTLWCPCASTLGLGLFPRDRECHPSLNVRVSASAFCLGLRVSCTLFSGLSHGPAPPALSCAPESPTKPWRPGHSVPILPSWSSVSPHASCCVFLTPLQLPLARVPRGPPDTLA